MQLVLRYSELESTTLEGVFGTEVDEDAPVRFRPLKGSDRSGDFEPLEQETNRKDWVLDAVCEPQIDPILVKWEVFRESVEFMFSWPDWYK